jgi:hypothetical protein
MKPHLPPAAKSLSKKSLWYRINMRLGFGFGLIDSWVFIYSAGSGIMGIGFGIFIVSLFCGKNPNLVHIFIALSVMIAGGVISEKAHRKLILKALEAKEKRLQISNGD